jgi:hypothetical protein
LANWDKNVDPDALWMDAGVSEGSLGGTGCCADVMSAVAKIAKMLMAHAAIRTECIMDDLGETGV